MVRYVEVNLKYSPAGGGMRALVVVEEKGRRTRLLYPPSLRAFWVDSLLLRSIYRELPTRGLAARIRGTRRERNLLNLPYSGPAVRQVLEALREGRARDAEEENDDALWGAREIDDEDQPSEGDDDMDILDPNKTAGAPATAAAPKKTAAKPAAAKPAATKAAAKPATSKPAVVADSKISGKPTPSPNAAPAAATTAAAPATKAAPAAKAPKTKTAKAGGRVKWDGKERVRRLVAENPSRDGSRLHKLFAEIKDGMTVADLQAKMKSKHSVDENVTTAMLRHVQGWGKVEVAAAK